MPTDKRKRMVVEEVSETKPEENVIETVPQEPLEEIKEKAQEIEELADEANNIPQPEEAKEKEVQKEQVTQNYPYLSQPKNGVNPLVIIIPGIFLLGGLLGGILFYQNKVAGNVPTQTDSPEIVAEQSTEPAATVAPKEVDLTKYNINILNGSGISGEAGKVKTLIEKAGFKTSGTGNAPNYSYIKTIIQAKSDVDKEFITKLNETLSESYSVDSKTATLSASSKDSVVVIVGSTKN